MNDEDFLKDVEKRLYGRVVGPLDELPPKMPICYAARASNEEIMRLIEIIRDLKRENDMQEKVIHDFHTGRK
jgi:hypothetical protein